MADRVFAGLLLLLAAGYGAVALTLKAPFQYDPLGPEAWPRVLTIALVIAAALMIRRAGRPPAWGGSATVLRVFGTVAGLVVYALVFEELGFIVATTAFCLALTLANGVSARNAALFALSVGVVGYFVCTRVLELNLPAGIIPV